mmetsp:Transcript_16634/g.37281  ORF Transcript_16634/g.37281 Transcript_16634/m.37281 type:complete len:132 (-) Transcript_16634:1040-1435(-)
MLRTEKLTKQMPFLDRRYDRTTTGPQASLADVAIRCRSRSKSWRIRGSTALAGGGAIGMSKVPLWSCEEGFEFSTLEARVSHVMRHQQTTRQQQLLVLHSSFSGWPRAEPGMGQVGIRWNVGSNARQTSTR